MTTKPAQTGHNSIAKEQLRSIVSRIENLNEEIEGLTADKREIFAEAKSNGFDVKALRKLIARRKLTPEERDEQDSVLEMYEGVFA